MNNSEIELELLQHYGLEKTIAFCEMTSFMYKLLYDDCKKTNPAEVCDFDYEVEWWAKKANELKTRLKPISS